MTKPIEILLAEDEEHIAKLVQFKLSRENFSVTWARNGQEAMNFLELKSWTVIILDVMMPLYDGWHVLKELRARPKTATTPVLMLTAKSHESDRTNAAELGATSFLRKPFDPVELAATIRKLASV